MGNAGMLPALLIVLFVSSLSAQDPTRFQEEVQDISLKYDSIWNPSRETIVFTGSSSIRFWEELQELYPEYQVVNTGFGGSHASDLYYYSQELILRFKPVKVFIYEGDNDLSERKRPGRILRDINKILDTIWKHNKKTEVVLIAAKPSLVRWRIRRKYRRLNRKIERLALENPQVAFADVWSVMLQGRKINPGLFVEDGLHMNEKGYQIWKEVIDPFVK